MYGDSVLDELNDKASAAWYRWEAAFRSGDPTGPDLRKDWSEASDALSRGLEEWCQRNQDKNCFKKC